ncbi:aldo/keto reductase [Rhodococcus opacus]|uniref:aldo/keto reductase n=1 Tax=Rhodococcus opacus TaxID=37919 RepID=UPI002473C0DC|nr:aldo/keto reductase [Rhodococcus opacus]MDH6293421.1 aryl-alcohol dehydrogenase-like predicted oxidoreductase [Rhodococcus opacus]
MCLHADTIAEYEVLCKKLGHGPAEVAQAWLLHQSAVSVIAGPRTLGQLESTLTASKIRLDADALAELDRIWPGPGEAPQSYAW